jgi:hypothetical protein
MMLRIAPSAYETPFNTETWIADAANAASAKRKNCLVMKTLWPNFLVKTLEKPLPSKHPVADRE